MDKQKWEMNVDNLYSVYRDSTVVHPSAGLQACWQILWFALIALPEMDVFLCCDQRSRERERELKLKLELKNFILQGL